MGEKQLLRVITTLIAGISLMLQAMGLANAGVYGLGKQSCAEFAVLYKSNPTQTENLFFSWAQGFMSGLDLGYEVTTGVTRLWETLPLESIRLQIRDFCDTHPLATYYSSVTNVYMSLPVKVVRTK